MKKIKLIIILGIVILSGGFVAYRYYSSAGFDERNIEQFYNVAFVQEGNIFREVSATGKVESPSKIDLLFKNSGRLILLKAVVGEKVKAGKVLALQDMGILNAQLFEAEAGIDVSDAQLLNYRAVLKTQQVKLEELKRGTRPEEIKVQEAKVEAAKISLEDSKNSLINKLKDAYTQAEDAVRGKIYQIFDNPREPGFAISHYLIIEDQLKSAVEKAGLQTESMLKTWKSFLNKFTISGDLIADTNETKKYLNLVVLFLEKSAFVVNNAAANSNLLQSTLDKWKTDISMGRNNVSIAIANLSAAEEKLRKSQTDLSIAENELILKKAGSTSWQIAAQEAQVEQAKAYMILQEAQINQMKASLQKIQAQVEDLNLIAPKNGIITEVNGEIGEIPKQDIPVVSLIPVGRLQIKVDVAESDIVNIKTGQKVKITLDAFGDNIEWQGKIAKTDPSETIKGGAVYYKTTIFFDKEDEKIKPGMTANIWVKTISKDNVLFIPSIAIKKKEGKKYVEIFDRAKVIQQEIRTGIKGTTGITEILSGLNKNERIIVKEKVK